MRPIGSKRQSRALNSMFCYKLPERAPDSEPPPVSWLVVGCKDRHNISHIQMFCEQIYSLITPSLLPHCGVGQKVTQPSASDHITGLSLYILICRSAKVIKDITFFILRYMLYGCFKIEMLAAVSDNPLDNLIDNPSSNQHFTLLSPNSLTLLNRFAVLTLTL